MQLRAASRVPTVALRRARSALRSPFGLPSAVAVPLAVAAVALTVAVALSFAARRHR
jgi:hypothetical protein